MKKILYTLLILSAGIAQAQTNTFPTSGNVGIGTTSPSAPLHVNGDAILGNPGNNTYSKLVIQGPNQPVTSDSKRDISFEFQSAGSALIRSYRGSTWDTYLQLLTSKLDAGSNAPSVRMHINHDGNIGIGTVTPNNKLEINGTGSGLRFTNLKSTTPYTSALTVNADGDVILTQTSGLVNGILFSDSRNNPTTPSDYNGALKTNFKVSSNVGLPAGSSTYSSVIGLRGWGDNSGGKAYELAFNDNSGLLMRSGFDEGWGQWKKLVIETENGSVGIGTSSIPTDYKLAVKGNIIAEKLVVKNSTAWPDFVFKKGYKLPSLNDVEQFISKNSHLPEIPSAKEVENNGQDVGEMNRLLLKKVEELTLYMIEMKKENDALKKRVEKLEK